MLRIYTTICLTVILFIFQNTLLECLTKFMADQRFHYYSSQGYLLTVESNVPCKLWLLSAAGVFYNHTYCLATKDGL